MSTDLKEDLLTIARGHDSASVFARGFLSMIDRLRDMDRAIDKRLAPPKRVWVLVYTRYGVNEGAQVIEVYGSESAAETERTKQGEGYSVTECDFKDRR